MDSQTLLHQNKVKNMGRVLSVISWLSITLCMIGILVMGFVLKIQNRAAFKQLELPPGISLDMTVGELLKADTDFMKSHVNSFGTHFIMALLFYIILSVIMLRIARAWRQGEPFLQKAIHGFRWLGILMLGQAAFGLVYESLAPESLSMMLTNSMLYDLALGLFSGSYGANLESAILFLTLSWVLEHGRMLKDEQDLTV